ncbi:MAG: hypothetical protein LLG37_02585 [Spirochaetia bacterium]|nr:hypothetical protein [Spirochaetia bacterium]
MYMISPGYDSTQGARHKSKQAGSVCKTEDEMPQWFKAGIETALPAAINLSLLKKSTELIRNINSGF